MARPKGAGQRGRPAGYKPESVQSQAQRVRADLERRQCQRCLYPKVNAVCINASCPSRLGPPPERPAPHGWLP